MRKPQGILREQGMHRFYCWKAKPFFARRFVVAHTSLSLLNLSEAKRLREWLDAKAIPWLESRPHSDGEG